MPFLCEALTSISTSEDKLDIQVEFHIYADLMSCLLIDLNLQNILVNQLNSNQIQRKQSLLFPSAWRRTQENTGIEKDSIPWSTANILRVAAWYQI